jgi:hypothetical protein
MAIQSLKPPGGTSSARSSAGSSNSNFAKAILEAGGHVAQSTVDSGVQMASDALGSLFGAGSGAPFASQSQDGNENGQQPFDSENFYNQEQQEQEYKQREMRTLRHREVQQMEVFDARKIERDRKIEQILAQLHALAKDLDETNRNAREAQIAVMQGATSTGDYHVSFFEHLLKVVVMLRQQVKEANTWLESFNSKKSAKKGYWGQFYQHGMQWAMSGERSIATSVG